MITIFLLCKYFKPSTTSLAHVGMKSANEAKSNSSTKWTKSSRVQRLFATPNGRKSKQEYSIIIENSRNRIMFLWPFVLFNSEASFSKQDFESMDSTLLFLATTFSGLSSVFCQVYGPKRTATQLIFFFEKFPLKLWQLWILFCLSFQTCWDFKARCHFVPFDKKGKALGTRLTFCQILARNCGPSPRFTNRVQSAFY